MMTSNLHSRQMSTPVVLSSPDHEVEELLQSDQSGSYPRTDNETRLRCHGVIARFQMRTALPRVEIARRALSVARAKSEPVEYFLVGEGASGFARDLGIRPSWRERAAAIIRRYAAGLYHPIVLCAAVGIAFLALEAARTAGAGAFFSTLVGLSVVTVALSYASAILRWATLAVVPIRSCARVMPCHASPDGEVLLLVLPVVISNAAHAHQLVGRLATLERTMNDPAVRFAMVSDFDDAATQAADGDVEI